MILNVNIVQRCSEHLKVTMFSKWNVQMECSLNVYVTLRHKQVDVLNV